MLQLPSRVLLAIICLAYKVLCTFKSHSTGYQSLHGWTVSCLFPLTSLRPRIQQRWHSNPSSGKSKILHVKSREDPRSSWHLYIRTGTALSPTVWIILILLYGTKIMFLRHLIVRPDTIISRASRLLKYIYTVAPPGRSSVGVQCTNLELQRTTAQVERRKKYFSNRLALLMMLLC